MKFENWWRNKHTELRVRQFIIGEEEFILLREAWDAAIKAEREECAKVCEEIAADYFDHAKPPYTKCAAAIRKRSNAPHERAAEGRPLDAVVGAHGSTEE